MTKKKKVWEVTESGKKKVWRALEREFQLVGKLYDKVDDLKDTLSVYMGHLEYLQEQINTGISIKELKKQVRDVSTRYHRIDSAWGNMALASDRLIDTFQDCEPFWLSLLPPEVQKSWRSR